MKSFSVRRSGSMEGPTLKDSSRADEEVAPAIQIHNLSKRFKRADGTQVYAVDDVSLEVAPGELVVLLGPSGCGKTTLLRCTAGLERPGNGEIRLNGKTVFHGTKGINLPSEARQLSMVFQSYALWPHMTAFDNVAYPLRSRGVSKKTIAGRIEEVLSLLRISELGKQYPDQMSGGQQQRVALARALVAGDGLVLFDEPLSNVDARIREDLRAELLEMHDRLRFTALYVTHDQLEAMELADSVAVMRRGRIIQQGPPKEMYERPESRYISWFLGSVNEIPGLVSSGPDAGITAPELGEVIAEGRAQGLASGDDAIAVVRPQHCKVSTTPLSGPNVWHGIVQKALYLGAHTEYVVNVNGLSLRYACPHPDVVSPGDEVWFEAPVAHTRIVHPT